MKYRIWTLLLIAAFMPPCQGQEQPALLTEPSDGSEAPAPEVRAVFKPAEVIETTVHQEGGRTITVQRLALDPNDPLKPVLPAQPAPVATAPEPEAQPSAPAAPFHLTLLSATVYPGPRSFLSWTHHFPDGTSRDFSGWSNLDFNHFSGINSFRGTDGVSHTFVMGIGTESSAPSSIPVFATTAPTFIPDQADIAAEALVLPDSLHKIYLTDGVKLANACVKRETARIAAEAELLANPPVPKDLIIRYRIAETPLPTEGEGAGQ